MKTISITNQKGGVGKTATMAAIGAGLCRSGRRVLYIDLDPQRNLSLQLGAIRAGATIYDLLTGTARTTDAIQDTPHGAIIAADARLSEKGILTHPGDLQRLKSILTQIQARFDVCLIDTPPTLGVLTVSALIAADGIIIPCKADRFSLDALHEIAGTVDAIRATANSGLTVYGVLITQYNGRTTANRLMLDELKAEAERQHMSVYAPPIRRSIAVEETQITGGTVYDSRNNAAADYAEIVKALLKQLKEGKQ